jgi:hypothetical protein
MRALLHDEEHNFFCAAQDGRLDVVNKLLENGANINWTN